MSDILSQSEIDQLLNALSAGELDVDEYQADKAEKQIKEYDFARPAKFAKDHLRTLEIIHEHYARLLATLLSGRMRTPCQLEVISSEAISYSEFANSLSNPVLLGILEVRPLKGNFVIEMSSSIGFAIVDRLLGGNGTGVVSGRDFTEIEQTVIQKVMSIMIDEMVEAWKNVVNIMPRLTQIETNPQFAQFISPTEIVALITLNLKIGGVEGLMNICVPYITIEPIIDKLNTRYWFSAAKETNVELYGQYIEKQIELSEIPMKVILGKTSILIDDFIHLQPGDIIRLDRKITEEVEVLVGNLPKFYAKAGLSSGKNAVMITSVMNREDE
ncbi:flagellar motor switch protein FliM [Lachnospiraceae bacterium oral taxon 500]|nr:flagellar motor switch protein FliM [Lachnospiraceae bacterium oral taxon 500]